MPDFDGWLNGQLAAIEAADLRRRLRVIDSPQSPLIRIDGRSVINFSSNDYLGLAADDRLRTAALTAIDDYGLGAGGSRLIGGTLRPHAVLEDALARFKCTEAALAFSTGYATALGTVTALVSSGDVIILDKLCHACLVDAARLSGAILRVFPHNLLEKLESHLRWARDTHSAANVLVLTESVFSMDGDTAALREIVELKERYGAWLLVDEAHAVGVIGAQGRGLAFESEVADRVEIQMGTLGKALGAAGGYIAGRRALVEFLVNRARSFIFSTAPAPAIAAAAAEAVRLLESGEADSLLQALRTNASQLAAVLAVPPPPAAILPLILGSERCALDTSADLLAKGFLVPAIRYPTVARGAARLRFTASAAHQPGQIDLLAAALAENF